MARIVVEHLEGLKMKFPPPVVNIEHIRKEYHSAKKYSHRRERQYGSHGATTARTRASSERREHDQVPMYPLRFEPIYQYRLWGGRHLADLLSTPLPGDGPIGEAWLLSDRDDHPSKVATGPLKGRTIRQLLEQSPDQMLETSRPLPKVSRAAQVP